MNRTQIRDIAEEERIRAFEILCKADRHIEALRIADIEIRFNSRLRRALGRALFRGGVARHVELAITTWVDPKNDNKVETLRDVLRHEFAHITAGIAAKHGWLWQRDAVLLGANPSRTCSVNVESGAKQFSISCTICGETVGSRTLHRAPHAWARKRTHRTCPGSRLFVRGTI